MRRLLLLLGVFLSGCDSITPQPPDPPEQLWIFQHTRLPGGRGDLLVGESIAVEVIAYDRWAQDVFDTDATWISASPQFVGVEGTASGLTTGPPTDNGWVLVSISPTVPGTLAVREGGPYRTAKAILRAHSVGRGYVRINASGETASGPWTLLDSFSVVVRDRGPFD
jgi:hypothetical protein